VEQEVEWMSEVGGLFLSFDKVRVDFFGELGVMGIHGERLRCILLSCMEWEDGIICLPVDSIRVSSFEE